MHFVALDVLIDEWKLAHHSMSHIGLDHARNVVGVSRVHGLVGVARHWIAEFRERIAHAAMFFDHYDPFVCFSSARGASRHGDPCP